MKAKNMEIGAEVTMMYKNDQITVYLVDRGSNDLLITFSPMNHQLAQMDYYARVPAEKMGMSILAFVSEDNNWFPTAFMREAIIAVEETIARFNARVIYGVSMGAYAAIKYSSALRATHVISVSPQWSINHEKTQDTRWKNEFVKNSAVLEGMEIGKDDTCGRIVVVYDPLEKLDKKQVDYISSAGVDIWRLVPAYSGGHTLGRILTGTDFLKDMIDNCIEGSGISIFCRLVSRKLKVHPFRWQMIIRRGANRHPKLVEQLVLKSPADCIIFSNQIFIADIQKFAAGVQSSWHYKRLCHFLERFEWLDARSIKTHFEKRILDSPKFVLNEKILSYNYLTQSLQLCSRSELEDSIFLNPVTIDADHGIVKLALAGQSLAILADQNGKVVFYRRNLEQRFTFITSRTVDSKFEISRGQEFGVLHHNSYISFKQAGPTHSAKFALITESQ